MTPQQQRALDILEGFAKRLDPATRAAYERALQRLSRSGDIEAAAEALASQDIAGAVKALLPPEATAQFAHDLTVAVATIAQDVGSSTAKEIASIVHVDFSFVPGSKAAARSLAQLIAAQVSTVGVAIEDGLANVLAAGLRSGANPRATAILAREFIGLGPYDAQLLDSFRQQIRSDPATALTRELRDARFDGTLRRAIDGGSSAQITDAQAQAMETAYLRRLKAWRAETWSRTTTLKAVRNTQAAAWRQMANDMGIDSGRLVKTWITTLDGRERPTHHALHGDTVLIDQTFANGDTVPGDGTGVEGEEWNCRCVMTVRVLPANGARAAEFLAQRRAQFAEARATQGRQPKRRVA